MAIIVLNKLFRGEYLNDNLGHEVINLFKSDNGKNYVYLNESGKFPPEYADKIKCMLLVKLGRTNTVEVIGKAEGLHDVYNPENTERDEFVNQIKFILDNDIKYGGAYLHTIFTGNEYQYVNISFTAKSVKRILPEKKVLISFDPGVQPQNGEQIYYLHDKGGMRNSLKEYFDEDAQPSDYKVLLLSAKNLRST